MNNRNSVIIILLLLLVVGNISAQTVFVWNNEIAAFHFTDPESGNQVGGEQGITQTLEVNNVNYLLDDVLPADLNSYDAVIVLCGSWCVS